MSLDIHHGLERSTKVLNVQSHNARGFGHAPPMDLNTRKTVGNNVKRLRELRGWNQAALARHCADTKQTTISSVERGIKAATIDTLSEIAEALNIPPWTLMIPADQMSVEQLKTLGAVVGSYVASSADGQHQIKRVAEAEERYSRAG